MIDTKMTGLLVRLPKGAGAALGLSKGRALGAAGVTFELEPLFETGAGGGSGPGAATGGWEWHVARAKGGLGGAIPWDLAHAALSDRLGLAAGGDVLVEPDLEQQWLTVDEMPGAGARAAAAGQCQFEDQDSDLPWVPGRFAWHLGDDYTDLKRARESVGGRVRIVHLDTGYDPNHRVLPTGLNRDLQRSFLKGEAFNDATDRGVDGLLKNPGHGTGTLGILAGGRYQFSRPGYPGGFDDFIGGAPNAEVIPVRVGNSVVQLYTSSVAAGIDYAARLCSDETTRVNVMSMSMGGVASQAWADAVNKAYEAGIVYVCAAGNNFSAGLFGVPTRFIVYPARFRRVIAACGVMADGRPYFGLKFGKMQGNWGPASKMATAMSAYTPNLPWAKLGCADIVDMDGAGTSSATPQIAAAAALYFQKYGAELGDRNRYPEAWMRVEAVRYALFSTARRAADPDKVGNGVLEAMETLGVAPVNASQLRRTPADDASFSFLHALTGLGAVPSTASRMLALEATQLAQQWRGTDSPNPYEAAVSDPDLPAESVSPAQRRAFLEALHEHPRISGALKDHLEVALGNRGDAPKPRTSGRPRATAKPSKVPATTGDLEPKKPAFVPPSPAFRRLRGYAFDPSLAIDLNTSSISEVTFHVPWEALKPGPVGEYLEVVDLDPGSGYYYEPVNLDDPRLLARDGLAPSEGTPQFHQQMVYAVASLTIHNFERALGRRALWRPGPSQDPDNPRNDSYFVPRLRIYPHALRERNAYYSPDKISLLFGYFRASSDAPGEHMAGGLVFSCLSHDIVAHETSHALLDGMNRSFLSPTNPDVHAFHEAFADLVALFQHFTFPEILRHQIATTRGDVRSHENLLGQLAGQFGRGTGLRTALRDAIGRVVDGKWQPHQPTPDEYEKTTESHARGAILVAAVFDAFLLIYERRTADLLRLATGGSGILQPGAIHPDLVNRLAGEASKAAQHVLNMCVRALDYCPPVDITFGEYLRAIITADHDLVPNDDMGYRTAFIQAFRRRALYPRDVRTLSAETLLWRDLQQDGMRPSQDLESALVELRGFANEQIYTESRESIFHSERAMRMAIHSWLKRHFKSGRNGRQDAAYLGLEGNCSFEVRSARIAFRTSPDGGMIPQLLVSILQRKEVPRRPSDPDGETMMFEGGCSLIADLRSCRVRYCIRKDTNSINRLARQQAFAVSAGTRRAVYFGPRDPDACGEPFAAIHRGLQED